MGNERNHLSQKPRNCIYRNVSLLIAFHSDFLCFHRITFLWHYCILRFTKSHKLLSAYRLMTVFVYRIMLVNKVCYCKERWINKLQSWNAPHKKRQIIIMNAIMQKSLKLKRFYCQVNWMFSINSFRWGNLGVYIAFSVFSQNGLVDIVMAWEREGKNISKAAKYMLLASEQQ